ncbi:MAG TPA: hypothetical protein VGC89_14610 [Pyrinomonadaceae bacterium]|jgi:hypothetical protein
MEVAGDERQRVAILGERSSELWSTLLNLELLETGMLIESARRLGLDPEYDSGWLHERDITEKGWVHNTSYAKLKKLVRDERLSIAEKWTKVIVPVLTALVSLLGLLIALITVIRK